MGLVWPTIVSFSCSPARARRFLRTICFYSGILKPRDALSRRKLAQAMRRNFLVLTSAITAPSSEKAAGINPNPGGTSPSDSTRAETDW
jgi:hypothetical protein